MSGLTLEALSAPLLALRLIRHEYAHLPAPRVAVSAVYPDLLELSFHDTFADFEVWREALGFDADSVEYDKYSGLLTLTVEGKYAGALVRLVGYHKAVRVGGAA
jgi:hypothetical protein